jgi:hypothetical protein
VRSTALISENTTNDAAKSNSSSADPSESAGVEGSVYASVESTGAILEYRGMRSSVYKVIKLGISGSAGECSGIDDGPGLSLS